MARLDRRCCGLLWKLRSWLPAAFLASHLGSISLPAVAAEETYNEFGLLISQVDDQGRRLLYAYDENGVLAVTTVIDANGHISRITHEGAGGVTTSAGPSP